MRIIGLILLLAFLTVKALGAMPLGPSPGVWTTNEDVYFAEEEHRSAPEWIGLRIDDNRRWQRIDPYGKALSDWHEDAIPSLKTRVEGGWEIDGNQLRRAQIFTCWTSRRKYAGKPDGSEDWSFNSQLIIFDQGGRLTVGGGDAPPVELRLRNVTWAKRSTNKPALVLYVHNPGEDRAVSYAWASPDANLIGINLRWVQASCSLVEK